MTGLRAGFVFRRPDPTAFIAAVRWAEQQGVQTAWTTQGGIAPDALAMFAVAATQTERIELWRSEPPRGKLVPTGRAFVPGRRPAPTRVTRIPPPASQSVDRERSEDAFGGGLHTTRLIREWVRAEEPFPIGPASDACAVCVALDRPV